ncbi:MFS transporter [Kocuria aegyptia]|uniref:MFS transporter n=2 Tax=Kocuria aegyptia TaxID=330943 RepID=A0ABN2KKX3_9MICC
MVTLDNSVLYTALPVLTADLGATPSESLWIINAYPLVMAGLLMGTGTLGDKVGHKRLFIWGLVVFGLSSMLAAYAATPAILIAARALLGVGAAMVMPATLALIRETFHDIRERNMAIAIWASIAIVGAALGPIVAGLLLERFAWGSVFLINVPIVLIALVAGGILAPKPEARPDTPWDLRSSLLALVGLASLVLFIKEVAKIDRSWLLVAVSLVAAVLALRWFTRRQARLAHPLLDFGIFRSRPLSAGVLAAGLALFAIAGVQLITTQRFQLAENYTPLQAGLLVTVIAVGSLPAALFSGAVMHRTGPKPLIVGGLAVGAVGLLAAVLALPVGVVPFAAGLFVTGGGLGAVMSAASSSIIGNIAPERAGMASSLEEVSYEFGSLTAVAILGSVFTTITATTSIATGHIVVMTITLSVVALGTVACALLLRGVVVEQAHGHQPRHPSAVGDGRYT